MIRLDITVHPTVSEPKVEAAKEAKKRQTKYRFPWRINMLSRPKHKVSKYHPPVPSVSKVLPPLDAGLEFRSYHISRVNLRQLHENKRVYGEGRPKLTKHLDKSIAQSWNSIYNYYRKQLRDKKLKRLKRKWARKKAKKPKGKELEKIEAEKLERLKIMAAAKKPPPVEKIPRKWKPLEELAANMETLAAPKERHIEPPLEPWNVNPAALIYEPTEIVVRLAKVPECKKYKPPDPWEPGQVKKSALTYKCTPNIEKLAQPSLSVREAKKHEDDKYDPWAISPRALKYKPTPRILELAKPMEKD